MDKFLELEEFLGGDTDGIFLYTNSGRKPVSYLFTHPVRKISGKLRTILPLVQKGLNRGLYAAGYACYGEGARACFGMFKKPFVFNALKLPASDGPGFFTENIRPGISIGRYAKGFNRIKQLIRDGEVYQVNYTFPVNFKFKGNPASFFSFLNSRQKTCYAAMINDGKKRILSISPELFFSIKSGRICMKPMKGTLLKPATHKQVGAFKKDEKTMAENVMIVDLARNDTGRICRTGSVKTGKMFRVEEYDTLYQMTSGVTGVLKPGTEAGDVFSALYPSGSVTGAPKKAAMRYIKEVEKWDRGLYTGAIGYMAPRMERAVFNIPIRTVVLDGEKGIMGVGSGIVNDSVLKKEYDECIGKAGFLEREMKLIESVLWMDGKYLLLKEHLARLDKSAKELKYGAGGKKAGIALKRYARRLPEKGSFKVKLAVSKSGDITLEHAVIKQAEKGPVKLAVSSVRMCRTDRLLLHKTTRREIYDMEYARYVKKGFDDVVFLNDRGEVTEAHSSNIFVYNKGKYYTPPIKCGLLPGTFRARLLKNNPEVFREKVLHINDIRSAEAIYLCNSVRGMRMAILGKTR
ncbi:MAG: chorismate-binding protein [Spirochaetia bacterium]|nr:chorismate-binding protein [Spirochaetia bacterium]